MQTVYDSMGPIMRCVCGLVQVLKLSYDVSDEGGFCSSRMVSDETCVHEKLGLVVLVILKIGLLHATVPTCEDVVV